MSWPKPSRSSPGDLPSSSAITCTNARPICSATLALIWHVIQLYLAQGFRRFALLTGYRREQIEHFVAAESWPAGTEIRCINTGEDTPTGGRVYSAASELGADECCVTYADGVADIDLGSLLAYHREHGAAATMTVVRPMLQFGVAEMDGDGVVQGF